MIYLQSFSSLALTYRHIYSSCAGTCKWLVCVPCLYIYIFINLFHARSLAFFGGSQYQIHNLSHLWLSTVAVIVMGARLTCTCFTLTVFYVLMGISLTKYFRDVHRGISSCLFWCHYTYCCCKTHGVVFSLLSRTEIQALFKSSACFKCFQNPSYFCQH